MCNVAEYIVMRRASHIINSIIHKPENAPKSQFYSPTNRDMNNIIDSNPFVGPDKTPESCVMFQRRIEDLFSLVFEGCRFTRFISIDRSADEFKSCNSIPMFLLEVFNPSHCYIPIYIIDDSVLAVSPFNNPAIMKTSKNPYLMELFPTGYVLSTMNTPGLDSLVNLLEETAMTYTDPNSGEEKTIFRRQLIEDMVTLFSSGIVKQDTILTRGFVDMGSEKVVEVSTESIYYKKMKNLYGMESMENGESLGDGVIDPTDFMPIYLTANTGSGFAILTDEEKNGKSITRIAIKPQVLGLNNNDRDIKAVLTKGNTSANRYFMVELDEYYYIGNNKAVAFLNGEIYDPINLLETYSEQIETGLPVIDEPPTISNEGVMDAVKSVGSVAKNVAFVIKKFGIKHGSNIAAILTQLFKSVGVKNVKWCMSQFASTFKRGLDLEKADTLELQEKLLNDELDAMEEKVNSYAKTWFRSVSLTVFCGGMIFFPISWLISRSRTKNARIRAMERLELRFDNIIERIERKINYAEERSENESVDQLIKERQMYQAARMRLLKLKDDAYGKKQIKYATFDKDLTMTAQQRIDSYLTGKRNDY